MCSIEFDNTYTEPTCFNATQAIVTSHCLSIGRISSRINQLNHSANHQSRSQTSTTSSIRIDISHLQIEQIINDSIGEDCVATPFLCCRFAYSFSFLFTYWISHYPTYRDNPILSFVSNYRAIYVWHNNNNSNSKTLQTKSVHKSSL